MNNNCTKCPDGCSTCQEVNGEVECNSCDDEYYQSGKKCIEKSDTCEVVSFSGCTSCKKGQYSSNNICQDCSSNCVECNNNKECQKCEDGYTNKKGQCVDDKKCEKRNKNDKCIKCVEGYYLDNKEEECKECMNGCQECNNANTCKICIDGFILYQSECHQQTAKSVNQQMNKVKNEMKRDDVIIIPNCMNQSIVGCVRCESGYYINDGRCLKCEENCNICIDETTCKSCKTGFTAENGKCVEYTNSGCKYKMEGSDDCVICVDGYYLKDGDCRKCADSCSTCSDDYFKCITCANDYYFNSEGLCAPCSGLNNCSTCGQYGCVECESGFYIKDYNCYECPDNCNECANGVCSECADGYVVSRGECSKIEDLIDGCLNMTEDKECTVCKSMYILSHNKKKCQNLLMIILIVAGIILFISIVVGVALIVLLSIYIHFRRIRNERKKLLTLFKMKYSNMTFKNYPNSPICVNKTSLLFDEVEGEIRVNEETRDLVCVGNIGKTKTKVQLSCLSTTKYEISAKPPVVTIKPGYACEFEVFIKPLCTCNIHDKMKIVYLDLNNGIQKDEDLRIDVQTAMSTYIDSEEVSEEKVMGEGSFGVVYKGSYRNNKVAIKKMKDNESDEMEKEIEMMSKLKNKYIIQFYGCVSNSSNISVVMELAEYGSFTNIIVKRDLAMNLRIMEDTARGVEYLHSNGIIHRDLKPDNVLIVNPDINADVCGKISDFGSARVINIIRRNRTFTSGIGTPIYMAPEILNGEHYGAPCDIFSMSIMLYESCSFEQPYKSKVLFPNSWSVPMFIQSGKRLEQVEPIQKDCYELICKMWEAEPSERPSARDTVTMIHQLFETYLNNKDE